MPAFAKAKGLLLSVAAAFSLVACGGGGGGDATLALKGADGTGIPFARRPVQTSFGLLAGVEDDGTGTLSWKGIPFASPPLGELRWKAPTDPQAWKGQRDATAFGSACIQNGRIYGPGSNNRYDDTIASTLNTPVGSEDCLTLNIWRPASRERDLPVIAFVYGGSNISGYTADPVYDGAALARQANAVVVTMNYRVGVLGFFGLNQLRSGSDPVGDSGNFALLDIVQALKFVQRDIAQFGGNPSNVTLMGQSAGAINVWALMTSPLADSLFHKVVPISGGISTAATLPPGTIPTLAPAVTYTNQANRLLHELLIADGRAADVAAAQALVATMTDAQVADYMRSKSAAVILTTVLTRLGPLGLGGSGPIPDGTVLPANPIAAIKAGQYRAVPVLAGNTRDEGKLFAPFLTVFGGPPGFIMDDATRFRLMANFDPNAPQPDLITDIVNPAYLPVGKPGGWTALTELLDDIFMTVNRIDVLNAIKPRQSNVWFYRFDWDEEPAPWNDVYGAAHAFDLPFIFGNFGPSLFSNAVNANANAPGRLALSSAMMQSIAAFARTGDPNNSAVPTWPAWPAAMVFDASPTAVSIHVEADGTLE
ncbi:MAG: carboxylesterase family protein [Burkholderiaceae bacterium]|jgi:para-nitrobenzyl esterase|nr:carboxylesterase family protein [Burkholderiaceae bacterium]